MQGYRESWEVLEGVIYAMTGLGEYGVLYESMQMFSADGCVCHHSVATRHSLPAAGKQGRQGLGERKELD